MTLTSHDSAVVSRGYRKPRRMATARSMTWSPLGAVVAFDLASLGVARAIHGAQAHIVVLLAFGSSVLAAVAGFAVDDAAADLLAASPEPLWRRRLRRVALQLAAVAVAWTIVATTARGLVPNVMRETSLGVDATRTLAWAVVSIALASVAALYTAKRAGLVAAGALVATQQFLSHVTPRLAIAELSVRWSVTVIVVAIVIAGAASAELSWRRM